MFGFFKKNKQVNNDNVKGFDNAIKAVKTYIELSDWANAIKALDEVGYKEKKSFENLKAGILNDNENELKSQELIKKEQEKYYKREKQILKIREVLEEKKRKYIEKIEKQRFEIRFDKIKDELNILIGQKKFFEAIGILQKFIEENKERSIALDFYNRERKKIQKVIDKQRKYEENKIKQNTEFEALTLIGDMNAEKAENNKEKDSFFSNFEKKFQTHKELGKNKKEKKLLDEINLLLEEDDKIKKEIAEKRLENIHNGLVKEINFPQMIGYDFYGKILGANKISGDTFSVSETKNSYIFFIGDATGHGIKAGSTIAMLNKLFNINYEKPLQELVFEINNALKQSLESRNFVTGIFFEINKNTNEIHYVGMGHEPMLVYRSKTKTVEKIIPGGLAIGISRIKDKDSVKVKELKLENDDILICYSDGLIELKNLNGEYYGMKRLQEAFETATKVQTDINIIYNYITNDVKLFRGGSRFDDDVTVILLKREEDNDILKEGDAAFEGFKEKEGLTTNEAKELEGKRKKEALEKLEVLRKEKEIKRIVNILKNLYYTGEMLQLKEEATRYIKEGYISEKINYYLKKAIENETAYKVGQKEQKIQARYNVLKELFKKGDYKTVIKEIEDIVAKDGNI